jgi:3-hydroxy-9,10-secoandrosta-1,3,5(10)-triene-9,17-dione monooxygenase reductase component
MIPTAQRRYHASTTTSVTGCDGTALRSVFAHVPAGVSLLTTMSDAGPFAMTASSVCCLSLEPPLVLACLDNRSSTLRWLGQCRRFGVSLLRDRHADLADTFAQPAADKSSLMRRHPHRIVDGVPVLDDALAWLTCRIRHLYPGGDHTIVIGQVHALGHGAGEPLVHHGRRYRSLAPALTDS